MKILKLTRPNPARTGSLWALLPCLFELSSSSPSSSTCLRLLVCLCSRDSCVKDECRRTVRTQSNHS